MQSHNYISSIITDAYNYNSFHNKLKNNPRYLAHEVNRRIDDLVGTLLVIEEDLFFDWMRKEVMRDSKEASIKHEGNDRHTRGMAIPDSAIEVPFCSKTQL